MSLHPGNNEALVALLQPVLALPFAFGGLWPLAALGLHGVTRASSSGG
jgi:hypothetical protein